MDDPDRRKALGATGSGRIKTQLAWEYSIPNLLSVYKAVLPAAGIFEIPAPRTEVPEKAAAPGAMQPVLPGPELDARKDPLAGQPSEVLSEVEGSTAFST